MQEFSMKRFVTIFLIFSTVLLAQEPKKEAQKTEATDNPLVATTYLDEYHASQYSEKMKDIMRGHIHKLGVLVTNFNSQVEKSAQDYDLIKETYKQGLELFYKNRHIQSKEKLQESYRLSQELYKRFALKFQEQNTEILKNCARGITDLEMGEAGAGQAAESTLLSNVRYKLQIAYGQTRSAEDMLEQSRNDIAIQHFRLAKMYGIDILKRIEKDPAKKAEIEKKYKLDLVDGIGKTMPHSGSP